ncbi:hypothetical protein DFH08DRAFT_932429 [Mycena albidolilacea]|uniref:F-box domain-containing protein n=1 Tax=Mycena albidolilacea TaxID=1033008 RepID=A0AAD7AH78_9AGAR|nr:hypothetical protein DFH08DRAFT_932429 [Mycena albidolilacea]
MIPQELVEAILSDVDPGSLKSCSLVSPGFCVPSQRLIFRSFRLEGNRKGPTILSNYGRAYTLLTDSPHLAAYITNLEIHLPTPSTSGDEINSLRRVLPLLACLLHGVYTRARWSQYSKLFSLDVLGFLSRQKLHSLSVEEILRWCSYLSSHPRPNYTSHSTTYYGLLLGEYTDGVSSLLCRPQFAAYIGDLRRLTITIPNPISIKLVSTTAYTLTHVCLDCRVFNEPHFSVPFPPLPNMLPRDTAGFLSSHAAVVDGIDFSNPSGQLEIQPSRDNCLLFSRGALSSELRLYSVAADAGNVPPVALRHPESHMETRVWPAACQRTRLREFRRSRGFFRRATLTLHVMGKVAVEKFVLDWAELLLASRTGGARQSLPSFCLLRPAAALCGFRWFRRAIARFPSKGQAGL